ncbi:hypothetical protein D3C78_1712820 [compost metagenome]
MERRFLQDNRAKARALTCANSLSRLVPFHDVLALEHRTERTLYFLKAQLGR